VCERLSADLRNMLLVLIITIITIIFLPLTCHFY